MKRVFFAIFCLVATGRAAVLTKSGAQVVELSADKTSYYLTACDHEPSLSEAPKPCQGAHQSLAKDPFWEWAKRTSPGLRSQAELRAAISRLADELKELSADADNPLAAGQLKLKASQKQEAEGLLSAAQEFEDALVSPRRFDSGRDANGALLATPSWKPAEIGLFLSVFGREAGSHVVYWCQAECTVTHYWIVDDERKSDWNTYGPWRDESAGDNGAAARGRLNQKCLSYASQRGSDDWYSPDFIDLGCYVK